MDIRDEMDYTTLRNIIKQCYAVLAPDFVVTENPETLTANKWPGRWSQEGQNLLIRLRDFIAEEAGVSSRVIQETYNNPINKVNPLKDL